MDQPSGPSKHALPTDRMEPVWSRCPASMASPTTPKVSGGHPVWEPPLCGWPCPRANTCAIICNCHPTQVQTLSPGLGLGPRPGTGLHAKVLGCRIPGKPFGPLCERCERLAWVGKGTIPGPQLMQNSPHHRGLGGHGHPMCAGTQLVPSARGRRCPSTAYGPSDATLGGCLRAGGTAPACSRVWRCR